METSLHRQLKSHYADSDCLTEVPLDSFRIDAVRGDWLVEIQHGSLAAIRDKIGRLVQGHQVLVVKPIIAEKRLVRRRKKGGRVAARRKSPKRGTPLNLFDELVYFTRTFPHPNLAIEALLVDVEEWRYPGHGRRRRRRDGDFVVEDQRLTAIHRSIRLTAPAHLWRLLPELHLPRPFHTGHLAEQVSCDRSDAQRITYVLRETGAVRRVGKQGNSLLYAHANGHREAVA